MIIKVTVKTLDSQNHHFEAEDDWTIEKFKEHIQSTVDVPSDQQRLIYCGRILQNDKKLIDYDCNEKVLHLVKRPPPPLGGVGESPTSPPTNNNNNNNNNNNDIRNIVESIRIIGDNSMGNPLDMGSHLNQVLRQVATTLQRALTGDAMPSSAVSTSIGVTITPHFVAASQGPITTRISSRSSSSAATQPPPPPPPPSQGTSRPSNNATAEDANAISNIIQATGRSSWTRRQQLETLFSRHPDWAPIIEADIKVMEQQRNSCTQHRPFSRAYLSSIPRKKRRVVIAQTIDRPILQPTPCMALANLLRRAATNSSVQIDDDVVAAISNNQELQEAYEEYLKSAVEARLKTDAHYCPSKFHNSRRYFM